MIYTSIADVYRDFRSCYVPPACCSRLHWTADQLETWLLKSTLWDGTWRHLSPALVLRAASVAARAGCPLGMREANRPGFGFAMG